MRLNKYIAESGVCSRREADKWIEAKRVKVRGEVATLGTQVEPGDEVTIDDTPLGEKKKPVYIALNKPAGIVCTTEAHVEDNIIAHVAHHERIFPIGRLDKESEGLILLTNDGDIVNEILRAENNHEKEYLVSVDRPITDFALGLLAKGVKIMGELTKPAKVKRVSKDSFRIVLTQGLNRQIRRMCSSLGYKVRHLKRVRIMHIELNDLKSGSWRALTESELKTLFAAL